MKARSRQNGRGEEHTGDIDEQDSLDNVRVGEVPAAGGGNGFVHEPALTGDAERVQDEERIVPQPEQGAGHATKVEVRGKVAVADDFGCAPGEEHGRVDGGEGRCVWEAVDDAPDQHQARGHLHEGCEEGCADYAYCSPLTNTLVSSFPLCFPPQLPSRLHLNPICLLPRGKGQEC